MNNAERIAALRRCSYMTVADERNDGYCMPCAYYPEDSADVTCIDRMMIDAADALEAAEQRIAELEADKKTLINVVKDKSDFHATKDAMRIAELEAQMPKEGEWIPNSPFTGNCSECGGNGNLKDNYCPNCGAKMKGDQLE